MTDPLLAAVGNTGGVAVIEHNGKRYQLHGTNDMMRAQLLRWVHSYVISETEKLREFYTPRAYREIQSDLAIKLATKQFGYGTVNYQSAIETEEGTAEFIRVVFQNRDLTDLQVFELLDAKRDEFWAKFKLVNGIKEDPDASALKDIDDPKVTTQPTPT